MAKTNDWHFRYVAVPQALSWQLAIYWHYKGIMHTLYNVAVSCRVTSQVSATVVMVTSMVLWLQKP